MSVPNRAGDPKRKFGSIDKSVHFSVRHLQSAVGGNQVETKWFGDKKSAKRYAKKVAGQGYEPEISKHDPNASARTYALGKPAPLMKLGVDIHRFLKGY